MASLNLSKSLRLLSSFSSAIKLTATPSYKNNLFRQLSTYRKYFKFNELEISLVEPSKRKPKPDPNNLAFGHEFSDHMFEVEWDSKNGWGIPRICQLHDLKLHPGAKVLHYAQACFEGMKAFYGVNNKVLLFRPLFNVKRLLNSTNRLVLPSFDCQEFLECLKKLVSIEKEWVPTTYLSSLYLRPAVIGTEGTLGVSSSNKVLLYVLCCPVGPYFNTGVREPISLLADPNYTRAWFGGIGDRKAAANYAPTIYVQQMAAKKNLQQVLWLHGEDHQITEIGTMNVFVFLINKNGVKELITPPLNGIILPGNIRQSVLDLTRTWNAFKVSERTITMKELLEASNGKRLLEVFGAGTACVICPIRSISYLGSEIVIPTSSNKDLINDRIFNALINIQYGKTPSPWVEAVD